MNHKEFKETIVDYISENLSTKKQQEFKQFLKDNPDSQKEIEEINLLWSGLEENVEPTTAMDIKFYTMLNAQKKSKERVTLIPASENFLAKIFSKKIVYTLAILAIGFFIGNNLNIETDLSEETLQIAQKETEEVRGQLVLTLLEQPSANKRLQAVSEVNKLNSVTETIVKALFSTLNNDANVNVRLSAIEALSNYTYIPLVREGLVASIIHQKSPMVQIALADLMVKLQEKKAVESFKKLIKEEDVNVSAKQKMEESIQRII